MKKWIVLIFLLFAVNAYPGQLIVGTGGMGTSGAPACPSGTFVGGAEESFECGAASFDHYENGTDSPTITGTVSTYDSGNKHSGTCSMSVDVAADTDAYVEWDLGATGTDFSIRLWFYAPTITQWKEVLILGAKNGSGDPGADPYSFKINWKYDATGHAFFLGNGSNVFTTAIYVTPDAWYKVQVDYNAGGNMELSVWNAALSEDDDSPQLVAEVGSDPRYLYLGVFNSTASYNVPKIYWDDWIYQAAGGDIAD